MPIVLNGTTGDISGSSLTGIDTGKILQVKQTVKTSLFSSSTNNSQVDVTGVNVSITPSSNSSLQMRFQSSLFERGFVEHELISKSKHIEGTDLTRIGNKILWILKLVLGAGSDNYFDGHH